MASHQGVVLGLALILAVTATTSAIPPLMSPSGSPSSSPVKDMWNSATSPSKSPSSSPSTGKSPSSSPVANMWKSATNPVANMWKSVTSPGPIHMPFTRKLASAKTAPEPPSDAQQETVTVKPAATTASKTRSAPRPAAASPKSPESFLKNVAEYIY